MPFLKVKLSVQESSVTSARVATILTDLITEILRKKRELTAVEIEYVDSNRWFVGGSLLRDQNVNSFYLEIKITDGTNTKDETARYVAQVFSAIEAIIGDALFRLKSGVTLVLWFKTHGIRHVVQGKLVFLEKHDAKRYASADRIGRGTECRIRGA